MRSARIHTFGTPKVINLEHSAPPLPDPGQVRVQIEASSVSFTDTLIRKGIYPLLKERPPLTLGYDFVGTIDHIGAQVLNTKIGTRVAGIVMTGGNAEYVCCSPEKLITIPEDIPAEVAVSFVISGMTAYQMLYRVANVKRCSRLLIHGASGAVGHMLLQLGREENCEIVGTASSKNHPLIEQYGAKALDYRAPDYFELLNQEAQTSFDAAFDFTNQKSFNASFRSLKKGGTLVTYAVYTSSLTIEQKTFSRFIGFGLDFGLMMGKMTFWNIFTNKHTAFYGIMDSLKADKAQFQADYHQLCYLYRAGKLQPEIEVFPLAEVQKAHELFHTGNRKSQIVISLI